MFDHVTIRVADRLASERFYDTVLGALGIERSFADEDYSEWGALVVAQADRADPPTRRVHLGLAAPSREHVDDFWRIGTEAGYDDDGRPGPRPQYRDDYYGSFLLDPDGNSIEAVHHGAIAKTAVIDHIWMRVADVAAAQRFYELVAPCGGFTPRADDEPVGFDGRGSSFSLVAGPPTEHLHIAFGTADDAIVDAFHRDAVAAGYRSNGAPGERPIYHAGYYAAFVLDPDGNNVEVVNHNR